MKIIANEFVKRQTNDSRFSHFKGTWNEIIDMVYQCWANRQPSYRDGVTTVDVPVKGFYSGVVILESGDELSGGFESRQAGENPRKFIIVKGRKKLPAESVDIILYSSKVLAENGDNELEPEDGNWEIISINASPIKNKMPIDPIVLMHNHFNSDGGTTTQMSDSEFVEILRNSFMCWKDKAMCG
jgi:hypothetical protein